MARRIALMLLVATALCLAAGCQSQSAPEGVRLYAPQLLERDGYTVSVETTSATETEAAASIGLSGGPPSSQEAPDG